jgi:hypothetical protein
MIKSFLLKELLPVLEQLLNQETAIDHVEDVDGGIIYI